MNIIEIKNLSFFYNKELVLDNINLQIKKGEYVVFIGPNGGGKTTLIKLILGLLHPKVGEIKLYTNKIGYVPQYTNFSLDIPINVLDVVLQGRLKKYKLFYNQQDKKIALEKLKLVEMEKYAHTNISNLSGGQRQRVSIARALYKDPDILIFDEATSALDNKSERLIQDTLKEVSKNKITFVIAHRLSTIKDADKIVLMDEGKIVCEGNEEYLSQNCEEYQKLK